MQPEKIQMIKNMFHSLPPEQRTEDYVEQNWDKFRLPNRKAARWFYNNHLKVNSVLACCCEETF